ncbi:TonB-dependent siderophore receptor [Stutzerimonas azotifigens]|uniref:TonB-dependent siderophore receptor n=1 Tax=Stutzerimonas azotifigens TaxID=291995 RepID=A0ABR5Z1U4_9GAMM|nr:TonB-dependent siderophore receptor [Stutzerimonas azotifigens]MBA1274129.1 TonB-dependent siderophore receptor [Stutzerimonas azotifigens]
MRIGTFSPRLFGTGAGFVLSILGQAVSAETESRTETSTVLDSVTVTGSRETADGPVTGYRAARSASATRTDTPLKEIPQSVSVVPASVLQDLDAPRIERALDFAGGVARQNDFGGLTMFEYSVRGLTTSEFYKDGFSANRGHMNPQDASNVERVEVLKGPASSLYGRGDPGGTVNIVSKRPQRDAFVRLDLSAGRWDKYRSSLDVNTPLDDEGRMLYRMNLAVEDNDSFRDHRSGERQFFAPAFSWELSPDTRVLVQAEVVRNRQVFDRGVVAPNGELGSVSRSAFFGEPSDGTISNNNELLQVAVEHDLNDVWSLRLASHYKQGRLNGYATEASSLANDGVTLNRERRYRDFEWQDSITQAELHGRFDTGSIEHQLLIGTEYERYAKDERLLRSTPTYTLDIRNPVFGQPAPPFSTGRTGRSTDRHELVHARALNLQDQMRFTDRLFGVIGARYDHYEHRLDNEVSGARQKQAHEKVTPRIGALYQFTPEVGVFANASRSFKPNGGADASGQAFDPEEGVGYEAGFKFDLLDSRLGMTIAAFHLTKENVLTADPADSTYQIAAGEVRSKGFDLQLTGQLTDQLRIIGAYAYVDAEVTKDNTLVSGSRLLNVPRNSGSLMTVYEFFDHGLQGLEVGGAVNYVGDRLGQSGSEFELPAYTTVDLLARYRATPSVTLGVNLNNAFDRTYYERSYSNVWVMPGEPRNLNFSVSLSL